MGAYLIKRILLIFPTLFFILLINFAIVQMAPGGPVEQKLMEIRKAMMENSNGQIGIGQTETEIPKELVEQIKKTYGFDKPYLERFWIMIKNYATFDFGTSYNRNARVKDIIKEKLPVSLSLGAWSTLLIYLFSIPLGIKKAINNGSRFDILSSTIVSFFFAFPVFLMGLILIIIFGPVGLIPIFPLRGLSSDNYYELSTIGKILDYFYHIALPVFSIVLASFASLTIFTKNFFIEELSKQYVITAKAKGASENIILYKHVFRNAILVLIAGLPEAILRIFLTGSLIIEILFSLDGIGLLSYQSAISRDYPIVFGFLFIYTLIGLIANILTDVIYSLVDPRINFDKA